MMTYIPRGPMSSLKATYGRPDGWKPPRKRRHTEDDEAMALIRWRDCYVRQYPQLALLIHLPMGGKRNAREAGRLKAMGARAGVSDYFLPCPRVGMSWRSNSPETMPWACPGLWLELKANGGKPTPAQVDWGKLMLGQGYAFEIAHGWVAAARVICTYLGIESIAP